MIKRQTLINFQNDLRNGMTIDEACRTHEISLDYAFRNMGKIRKFQELVESPVEEEPVDDVPVESFDDLYLIQKRSKYFQLRKTLKGKMRVFGTYSTLEDAVKVRDYCLQHGWDNLAEACEIVGVKRRGIQ